MFNANFSNISAISWSNNTMTKWQRNKKTNNGQ